MRDAGARTVNLWRLQPRLEWVTRSITLCRSSTPVGRPSVPLRQGSLTRRAGLRTRGPADPGVTRDHVNRG